MNRRTFVLLAPAALLAGCVSSSVAPVPLGPDGRPLPQVYRIGAEQTGDVAYRFLDAVNALRQARSAGPLQLNASLNAAAETHSRDMSMQNRPWHFGSDGSSPLSRVQRSGYQGRLLGENISETYQTELETLAVWMEQAATRDVLLDPAAREIGFAWYQEPSGKIWWTAVTGG